MTALGGVVVPTATLLLPSFGPHSHPGLAGNPDTACCREVDGYCQEMYVKTRSIAAVGFVNGRDQPSKGFQSGSPALECSLQVSLYLYRGLIDLSSETL